MPEKREERIMRILAEKSHQSRLDKKSREDQKRGGENRISSRKKYRSGRSSIILKEGGQKLNAGENKSTVRGGILHESIILRDPKGRRRHPSRRHRTKGDLMTEVRRYSITEKKLTLKGGKPTEVPFTGGGEGE